MVFPDGNVISYGASSGPAPSGTVPVFSRPRKFIALLIAFLLFGAVVNVAVAWTFAISIDLSRNHDRVEAVSSSSDTYWFLGRADRIGITWIYSSKMKVKQNWFTEEYGLDELEFHPAEVLPAWANDAFRPLELRPEETIRSEVHVLVASGWPMPSLWCQSAYMLRRNLNGQTIVKGVRGGLRTDLSKWSDPKWTRGWRVDRALPLRPIWIGFAIDTVFYAVALWLPIILWVRGKRWLRCRRGQCPKCAYPSGESPRCTECGEVWLRRPQKCDS